MVGVWIFFKQFNFNGIFHKLNLGFLICIKINLQNTVRIQSSYTCTLKKYGMFATFLV